VVFRLIISKMQASEFEQYFEKYPFLKKHFLGIFAIDTLPKLIKYRQFCICNTDKSTESGQHWFCFVKNSNYELECFDSLGLTDKKKENLLKYCSFRYVKELKYNETSFQSEDSTTCGLFTVYFLIERMHNLDLTFNELLEEIFDEDKLKNELKVENFCKSVLEEEES
jgi:hypothetical protein